jgi:hypothetical protein
MPCAACCCRLLLHAWVEAAVSSLDGTPPEHAAPHPAPGTLHHHPLAVPIYDSLGESAVEYIVKHSGGLVVRGAAVGCINAGHRGGWGGGGVPGWVEGLLALQCIHSPAVATWHTGGATGPRGPSPHPCSPYRWLISSLSLPAPLPPPRDALGPGGHCQPGQVCQGGRRREGLCEEE